MKNDIIYSILIYLLMTITFLLIFIYLVDPSLCQDLDGSQETTASSVGPQDSQALVAKAIQERLETLESIGESDLLKLHKAINKYNSVIAIYEEATKRPERDNGLEHLIGHGLDYYLDETKRCLSKFRLTEAMAKTLNPRYTSCFPKQ
jgi:hypothetical protein